MTKNVGTTMEQCLFANVGRADVGLTLEKWKDFGTILLRMDKQSGKQ